ncbi:MAG TPA: hypothetical protein VN848_10260 [Gemmatimonadales bacterium]|nr:hypothetical protein [Gemmatimonadales bacterium]
MKRTTLLGVGLVATLALAACGGHGSSAPPCAESMPGMQMCDHMAPVPAAAQAPQK